MSTKAAGRLAGIHAELEAEGYKRGTAAFAREALKRTESGHTPKSSSTSPEPTPATSTRDDDKSSDSDEDETPAAAPAPRRRPTSGQLYGAATSSRFAVGSKPSTAGGLAAGVLLAVLLVNYARGGSPQVRQWFAAKFTNSVQEGPGNGTASLIKTWGSPLQTPTHPTALDPYPARPTPQLPGVKAPAPNPVLTKPDASGPSWLQLFPTGG